MNAYQQNHAARLRAAAETATGWQDITTAPKDGTLILARVSESTEPHLVRWADGHWRNNHYGGREPYWYFPCLKYWRPIPPAPGADHAE